MRLDGPAGQVRLLPLPPKTNFFLPQKFTIAAHELKRKDINEREQDRRDREESMDIDSLWSASEEFQNTAYQPRAQMQPVPAPQPRVQQQSQKPVAPEKQTPVPREETKKREREPTTQKDLPPERPAKKLKPDSTPTPIVPEKEKNPPRAGLKETPALVGPVTKVGVVAPVKQTPAPAAAVGTKPVATEKPKKAIPQKAPPQTFSFDDFISSTASTPTPTRQPATTEKPNHSGLSFRQLMKSVSPSAGFSFVPQSHAVWTNQEIQPTYEEIPIEAETNDLESKDDQSSSSSSSGSDEQQGNNPFRPSSSHSLHLPRLLSPGVFILETLLNQRIFAFFSK